MGWLSALLLSALLLSRVLLLPDGPWEQDEAIFSTAVHDFDMVRHRPQPPAFPVWIFLGKLLTPVTSDALLSLRIWSSLSSVLTVLVLSHLLVPVAGPLPALLGAFAYGFAPLTWAHAHRAFADTPAAACALLAAWLWLTGLTTRRLWASLAAWGLLATSAAIRLQLVPELFVVGLAGVWLERTKLRSTALGVALALALLLIAFGVTILDSGGWSPFWISFFHHLGDAKEAAEIHVPWNEMGIVRGVGGSLPAALLALSAVVGIGVAFYRHRQLGAWLGMLLATTCWAIIEKHLPSIPRYSVVLLLAATPAVMFSVSLLPTWLRPFPIGLVLFAAVGAAVPPMRAMHNEPLPAVAALRTIAASSPKLVLYPANLFSFARYATYSGEISAPAQRVRIPFDEPPTFERGTYALFGPGLRFLTYGSCTSTYDHFPSAAWQLSQKRFNVAVLARDPVILGNGIHDIERQYTPEAFAWLSDKAELHVPGPTDRLFLHLRVPSDRAPQRLAVYQGRGDGPIIRELSLAAGQHVVRIVLDDCSSGCVARLELPGARSSERDSRLMSARLEAAWAANSRDPRRKAWSPGVPQTMTDGGVMGQGFHVAEHFAQGRPGAWTYAEATASFPGGAGAVTVQMARPRNGPVNVTLRSSVHETTVEVGGAEQSATVLVDGKDGRGEIALISPTFVPAELDGSRDRRALGVQLLDVEYLPLPSCAP